MTSSPSCFWSHSLRKVNSRNLSYWFHYALPETEKDSFNFFKRWLEWPQFLAVSQDNLGPSNAYTCVTSSQIYCLGIEQTRSTTVHCRALLCTCSLHECVWDIFMLTVHTQTAAAYCKTLPTRGHHDWGVFSSTLGSSCMPTLVHVLDICIYLKSIYLFGAILSCFIATTPMKTTATNCGYLQFPCHDGQCINRRYVCNGKNNCYDGSDEDYCYNSTG